VYAKADIFNIALQALLLTNAIIDPDTDATVQGKVLRQMYPIALNKCLADLDLNRTATKFTLELLSDDPDVIGLLFRYCYKYPSNTVKLRRIISSVRQDNQSTIIPFETGTLTVASTAQSVIYCDEADAVASVLAKDVPLSSLNASAGLALGYQLAFLSSSLIVGKGAKDLKKQILDLYVGFKAEAQLLDLEENPDTTPDEHGSEFVNARLGGGYWPLKT
jgi:hypothetical protein